jgi:hypothetical protein
MQHHALRVERLSWERQRARAERLTAITLSVAAGAAAAALVALMFC